MNGALNNEDDWQPYEQGSLPDQYKPLEVLDSRNIVHSCFRCGPAAQCMELGSPFGGALMIEPVKWRYASSK